MGGVSGGRVSSGRGDLGVSDERGCLLLAL